MHVGPVVCPAALLHTTQALLTYVRHAAALGIAAEQLHIVSAGQLKAPAQDTGHSMPAQGNFSACWRCSASPQAELTFLLMCCPV